MKEFVIRHKRLLFSSLLIVIAVFFYKCPIKLIFGIECPGCGMTRAFVSALRLDFLKAFHYHPLFLPVGIEFAYVIFYDYIRKFVHINKRAEEAICFVTLALLLLVWLFRQFIK